MKLRRKIINAIVILSTLISLLPAQALAANAADRTEKDDRTVEKCYQDPLSGECYSTTVSDRPENADTGAVRLMAGTKLKAPTNLHWEPAARTAEEDNNWWDIYPGYIAWDTQGDTETYAVKIYDGAGTVVRAVTWYVELEAHTEYGDDFLMSAEKSGTYTFSVQAVDDENPDRNSAVVYSGPWQYTKPSAALSKPAGVAVNGTRITWNPVSNAGGYQVQRGFSKTGDADWIHWGGGFWSREGNLRKERDISNDFHSGAGYYYFRVRTLSNDISQICNSPWSDYVVVYSDGSSIQPERPTPGHSTEGVPVHSNDESQILSAALTQTDMENLLPDITSGMDKLRGPSISIAGETFYLFEIDSKLDIDLGEKGTLQMAADCEKKTVQVLLGYKPLEGGTTIVGDPNTHESADNDFWKAYTNAKSLYKMTTGGSANNARFRSKFQDVYDELQEFGMDMIVQASGRICGYAEFSYETGKLEFSEGGVILAVSVNATQNGRIPSFPAAYVTLRFGVSVEGKLQISSEDTGVVVNPTFDADLLAAIAVGLGDNTGKFQAYIEGGFDGDLGMHVRPRGKLTGEDPFSVDMTGNLYFAWKLKAWILEGGDTYKKQLFKLGLYPRLELLGVQTPGSLTMADLLTSAKPVTREYLNAVSLMAVSDDYSFEKIEYPYAEPTLMRLHDGRMLMVWVGDSGLKNDGDRTSIYYAVYSGGTWSTPAIINESGTYNDHPVLCTDGTSVYAVWMQADCALNGMEAEEALRHMDLVFSLFDGTQWSDTVRLSAAENGVAETDYAITAHDGTVSVVWLENSENDFLMASGTNTIRCRSRVNEAWTDASVICQTGNTVTGLGVDQSDGLRISYSLSHDGTTTTYVNENGMPRTVEGAEREAKWIGGKLYELRDTSLYCNGNATGLEGLTNFDIISDGRQTVALTLLPTGFTCELFGSYYDEGTDRWGAWVQLTGFGKYIRDYSAVLDESGKIVAALNLVDVDADAERVYDNTSAVLAVVDDCSYNDLIVEDWIAYDSSLVAPNALVPLSFKITNNSAECLTEVAVSMNEQESKTIPCNVASGESAVLTADYQLPSDIRGHAVVLTVTPHYSGSESNTANNKARTVLGLADLVTAVSAPELVGDEATVAVDISNAGYADAENVVLTVYRSNAGGEVLQTENLGTVAAGSHKTYEYTLPESMLFLDDPDTMYALYAEAVSDAEERELVNNSDRTVFGNLLPMQVISTVRNGVVSLNISADNDCDTVSESVLIAAAYSENGKMLTAQVRTVQTEARGKAEVDLELAGIPREGNVCVKVFWLGQDSYEPVIKAWEQSILLN